MPPLKDFMFFATRWKKYVLDTVYSLHFTNFIDRYVYDIIWPGASRNNGYPRIWPVFLLLEHF